ncbi:hypothetical protein ACFU7T_34980 [Streptomyces sp. NPDC057555]|uniref:hypothetical protein n=1 Tax=Streptomyces sp. NPDC057555 TaxID=3346166 RepID=UPI0036C3D71A
MAETRPHITVSHHDRHGVVAAASHDNHVADHMLRRVGFRPLPSSNLYALTEPNHDPTRRGQQAVQSLRAAQYTVTSDAAYDLNPHTPPTTNRSLPGRMENRSAAVGAGVGEAAIASARALDADIRAARIVVHDQVRDSHGTLRAVGTDVRTREGLLLHGEGDLRYVEARLEHTGRAFDAFYAMPGNERRDPRVPMMQRAQAASAISPARAGVALPQQPAAAAAYRPASATQQPVRAR